MPRWRPDDAGVILGSGQVLTDIPEQLFVSGGLASNDNINMAVNTFVKDCEDPNPLIRALAVRTMGCIRVDKITEYLCEPLRKCLKDEDPYVRKTAAVSVAKLHDINATLVEEQVTYCIST